MAFKAAVRSARVGWVKRIMVRDVRSTSISPLRRMGTFARALKTGSVM